MPLFFWDQEVFCGVDISKNCQVCKVNLENQ
ncbi:hypothetical protein V6Z12_A10G228700 [Gossypium hirsutum]